MRGLSLGACPSKYLDKRWKLRDKQIHKEKLRGVKSTIRSQYQSAPFGIGLNPVRNGKKEAIMEQRYTEIERENRILLEKMSNIMQNPKPNLYTPSNHMQATQQLPPHKKSLNRERRRRDLVKITMENQAFLKRLQQKSATYSVEKWENEFVQQTKYRDLVCENAYEFGDGLPRSRLMTAAGNRGRLEYTQADGMMGGGLPRIGSQSIQHRDQLGVGMYQTLNSQKNLQGKRAIIKQAEQLDENRIVLYKKGRQLGQGYYIVEISSNNTHLFIAAYDVESPESLLIELPERRAADILNEFNNDYEGMASSLQVMNKRLVLLNPKFINQKRHGTAPTGQPGRPPLPSQGQQSNLGQSQEMSGVINQEQSNIQEEAPNQEQDQQMNQAEGGVEINIEEQNQQQEDGDQQQQDDEIVQENNVE